VANMGTYSFQPSFDSKVRGVKCADRYGTAAAECDSA
jgi:hypothetical protein